MAIRRGEEFLQSLRDGRRVWLGGEEVRDVTTHPALAGCAQALAQLYDLQHDPAHQSILTMKSPSTAELVSLGYILPTTLDDLLRRRRMMEFFFRRTGGVAARLPEYVALILVGLYDARGDLAEDEPAFAEHAARYFEHCREGDLCLTHAFADPSRDQSRPLSDYERLHVAERKPNGVVIRGAKSVGTLAPFADEFLGATLQPIVGDDAIWFAVPMNARGLHTVCRQPLVPPNPEDHPLSPSWDEMDAQIIFDDVFVPWDRVFYLKRVTEDNQGLLRRLVLRLFPWSGWHILTRMAVKAEMLAGICAAISDYLGIAKQPSVQSALADLIIHVETLWALVKAAEASAVRTPSGLLLPNYTMLTVGRILAVERHPQVLQLIRELCGSGILMAPGDADMTSPEIGPHVVRYFVGKDERARERYRMLKLAWEYACDSFGSRQLLFEMYNAGGSITQTKIGLANSYSVAPFVRLAKELAGIGEESAAG